MIKIKNIKHILKKDDTLRLYLYEKYGNDITIKFSNYGFIIVNKKKHYVYKFYLHNTYLNKNNINIGKCDFHVKEYKNYTFLKNNGIELPNYKYLGIINFGPYIFYLSEIENIRIDSSRLNNFKDLNPVYLVDFLLKLHKVKNGYIHGNIHPSNFYIKNGKIGIFDLVNYGKGDIEFDLSRILTNSNYDIEYFKKIIYFYGYKKIDYTKLYYYIKRNLIDDGEECNLKKISSSFINLLNIIKNEI